MRPNRCKYGVYLRISTRSAWPIAKQITQIIKKRRSVSQHAPPSLRTLFDFCMIISMRPMWESSPSTKVLKNYEDLINTKAY